MSIFDRPKGDKTQRFEAQILPHLDAAYRFARWLSQSPSDADDIVQETMLRAFRALDSLKGDDAKVWLLTIVRNCHRSAFSQQLRRASVSLPDEATDQEEFTIAATDTPEAQAIAADTGRALDRLMAALPEEYREVLILRELEDMSYRDIATMMNTPIGTVMSRLARARLALREQWQDRYAGDAHALR